MKTMKHIITLLLVLALLVGACSCTPEPALGSDNTMVYVTAFGEKYHTAECHYLTETAQEIPLSRAREQYAPCSYCKPPSD